MQKVSITTPPEFNFQFFVNTSRIMEDSGQFWGV